MRLCRVLLVVVALVSLLVPAPLSAQALPNLTLLRVRYNSAKTAAKPDGELKAQIDALQKRIDSMSKDDKGK